MTGREPWTSRLRSLAIPGVAGALGVARGSGLPATSDAAFHLVRAGNSLLRGSLAGWAEPPGGLHAPVLGALATAFGALFADDPERKILISGCLWLGAAAALLARTLAEMEGHLVAVLGVALLLLPPGLASSFNHRPDAALGGVLLLVAAVRALRDEPASRALWPAWIATLATPWALPAALALHVAPGLRGQRDVRAFAPALTVVVVVAALSWSLRVDARSQVLVGLFGEVGPPGGALRESLDALRIAWGGGLLLLPLALAATRRSRVPARVLLPWGAAAGAALLFGGPGAFLAATAALAPTACLVSALAIARLQEHAPADGASRRPLVLALLLPVFVALLTSGADQRLRDRWRGEAVRDAQIGAILWASLKEPGTIAADRTGALAALSGRVAHPLRKDGTLPTQLPRYVVLSGGRLPLTDRERTLFASPGFLAAYAPIDLRRGRDSDIPDAVWSRRAPPAAQVSAAYANALRTAWAAQAVADSSAALRFREAAAIEPAGLGLAHEGLGIELERRHEEQASAIAFEEARSRDPACVLARGHLADRAITHGEIPRADSLISEAFRFQRELAELRGTRARLFAECGYPTEAEKESAAAIRANERDARLLVNHGVLLWRRGAAEEARVAWRRAITLDPQQVRYLGNFEAAPTQAPAPPLRPLFSDVGFTLVRPPADVSAGKSSSAPPHGSRP